jgi:hypothetical protein
MKYKTARLRGVDRRDFLRGAGAVASSLAGFGVDHSWQRRGGQSPLDKEKAQEHHPDVRPAPLADALTESLPDYGKKTVITAGLRCPSQLSVPSGPVSARAVCTPWGGRIHRLCRPLHPSFRLRGHHGTRPGLRPSLARFTPDAHCGVGPQHYELEES